MAEEKKSEILLFSRESEESECSSLLKSPVKGVEYSPSQSLENDSLLSILVVNFDYILTKNSIDENFQILKGNPVQPVIRVFGSTSNGQRACLHLHGVLPYIYFRPENLYHVAFESEEKVKLLLPILEKTLEDILFLKRQSITKNDQYKSKRRKHIHHLEVVKKKTIYGMCVDSIVFVKIYLNDPGDIKRIASILDEGALAGITMQTYESHIPYLLKFTTDFNISPMGWLHLSNMKFRPPLPSAADNAAQAVTAKGEELVVMQTPAQVSTPSFASPLKTQFPFLSAMSPIRGKLHLISSTEQKLSGSEKGDKMTFFTQESVPKSMVWSKEEEETIKENAENDGETSMQTTTTGLKIGGNVNSEVLELFDGINPEDLFTQRPKNDFAQPQSIQKSPFAPPPPWIREKDSTCEVELDSHCSFVLNATIPRGEFGAELWSEERIRCARKGINFDPLPVAPFSFTFNRDLYLYENDFAVRLKRLQRKGIALRKTSQKIIKNANERYGDVLSQFLTGDDAKQETRANVVARNPLVDSPQSEQSQSNAMDIVNNVALHPEDQDIQQWVQQSMEQTLLQSQIDEFNVSDMTNAPDSILEEYIKSQISQASLTKIVSPIHKDMKDTSSQSNLMDDDDDELVGDDKKQLEDILSCTQGDNIYEVLQSKPKIADSVAPIKDNVMEMKLVPKVDVIELLDEDDIVAVPNASEPAATSIPISVSTNVSVTEKQLSPEEPTQYEKLLPSVRRRSDPDSDKHSNRLTSAFKRFKKDHNTKVSIKTVRFQENNDSNALESKDLGETKHTVPQLEARDPSVSACLNPPPVGILKKVDSSKIKKSVKFASDNVIIPEIEIPEETPLTPPATATSETIKEQAEMNSVECIDLTTDSSPLSGDDSSKISIPESTVECITLISPPTPDMESTSKDFTNSNKEPSPSCEEGNNLLFVDSDLREDSFYQEFCGAKTLIPTFTAPKLSELADLDSFGLLPVINPPASYSKLQDVPKVDINATTAYNQIMMTKHPIYSNREVTVFDAGFSNTMPSMTKVLFPNSTDILALYPQTKSRKRCLVPNFHPPKPSLFQSKEAVGSKKWKNPNIDETSWEKSQIATPTQTQHTVASDQANLSNTEDTHQESLKSLKFGVGNEAFMNKMTRLITLSMELFCVTRKDLLPNPKYDAIQMLIWIAKDTLSNAEHEFNHRMHGIIALLPPAFLHKTKLSLQQQQKTFTEEEVVKLAVDKFRLTLRSSIVHRTDCFAIPKDIHFDVVLHEKDLFQAFVDVVQGIDPDFLMGYESQSLSFGYFIKRGQVLGLPCLQLLSRLPKERPSFRNTIINIHAQLPGTAGGGGGGTAAGGTSSEKHLDEGEDLGDDDQDLPSKLARGDDQDDANTNNDNVSDIGIYIKGRTFLNIWQIMRSEVRLYSSSLEHVIEQVLQERIPCFTWSQLSRWYLHPTTRCKVVDVIFTRTVSNILLLDKLDLIRKFSESARLYGIDFYSVLNRGSQYRVEAALLIRSNALDYVMVSPSRIKVAQQAAMEVIPLVMEPKSGFYKDPVLVLDFQSLYPSMMIAYNLCFSTCLGKLLPGTESPMDTTSRLGVVTYPETMTAINSTLHLSKNKAAMKSSTPFIAPNGSVFCSKEIRHGILPRMVKEMLQTRLMVKRAMKLHCNTSQQSSSTKVLEKVLDARQLAIKLLCNVTYGYTAAGFSGRMPMAELADAIVQCGRSTLEWTMKTIESHPTWKAEVIYGDTDSVFVHLPGRTLEQAFAIGEEIARDITSKQPEDVVLKFEKVYYPCILLTKKRYVGNCFESVHQKHSHLDAKGIEMIRRDQCAAVMKIQEKALRLLFSHRDMSLVKSYITKQWTKILQGLDSIVFQDFIFFKEVKFGHYASVSSQPPGAIVATKAVLQDEMAVPPYNWRVPYIVVQGLPNAQLKNLVHDPKELLRRGSHLRLNVMYYIAKCINPALDRVLSLCGVDVQAWFRELSKPKSKIRHLNYDLPKPYDPPVTDKGSKQKEEVIELDFFGRKKTPTSSSSSSKLPFKQQTLMDQFTTQATCELCPNDAQPQKNLCSTCITNALDSMTALMQRLNLSIQREKYLESLCRTCTHSFQPHSLFTKQELISADACESIECPIFFERNRLVTRIEDYQLATRDISSTALTSYDI